MIELIFRSIVKVVILLFLSIISISCMEQKIKEKFPIEERSQDRAVIKQEMEEQLLKGILNNWYPLCIDSLHGGFLSGFNYKWEVDGRQPKFIVTQSRHVWTLAQASKFFTDNRIYQAGSKHGFEFLKDIMWDETYGGFFEIVSREGELLAYNGSKNKTAYGNAFAIYGLSAYYEISKDESALALAKETFEWLEKNSHDKEFGGYFQYMDKEGNPYKNGYNKIPPKDQNSSIHLLEAFTELYKVWPDEFLRKRLFAMLILIRDVIVNEHGYLNLFFRQDWTPVYYDDEEFIEGDYHLDHISFGHDVETGYLMIEASKILGIDNDTLTHRIAKKMIDHAISFGWNINTGAIYDRGHYLNGEKPKIVDDRTAWWSACEAFNAFLLMSELYPEDPNNYFDKFTRTWNYCKNYLIDHENGGWFREGIDKNPDSKAGNKADIWKGNYHNSRALINCITILGSEGAH